MVSPHKKSYFSVAPFMRNERGDIFRTIICGLLQSFRRAVNNKLSRRNKHWVCEWNTRCENGYAVERGWGKGHQTLPPKSKIHIHVDTWIHVFLKLRENVCVCFVGFFVCRSLMSSKSPYERDLSSVFTLFFTFSVFFFSFYKSNVMLNFLHIIKSDR